MVVPFSYVLINDLSIFRVFASQKVERQNVIYEKYRQSSCIYSRAM